MKLGIVFLLILLVLSVAYAASPVIDSIVLDENTYTPTENSTTPVNVIFNVTDSDGEENLNDSACKCEFDNSAEWQEIYENAADTVCDTEIIDADTVQYTCVVDMQYWYENNTYSVNITVKDNETQVNNISKTFNYTHLVSSVIDTAIIDFGTIASSEYSTNKTDINSPMTVINTGNQPLTLKITGADLADNDGIKSNISVSQFFVNDDSSPAGALQLTNFQQPIPSTLVPVEDSTPGGNTEEIWWFFSVPNPLPPSSYTGSWLLTEE
jgi:hypothetical protein